MRHCNCKSKFRDVFNFLTWTPCMIFYLENITSYLFFVKLCHYLPDLTIDLISPLGSRMLISFNFSLTQIKGRCIHLYIHLMNSISKALLPFYLNHYRCNTCLHHYSLFSCICRPCLITSCFASEAER